MMAFEDQKKKSRKKKKRSIWFCYFLCLLVCGILLSIISLNKKQRIETVETNVTTQSVESKPETSAFVTETVKVELKQETTTVEETKPEDLATATMYVMASRVNVREAASTEASVIGELAIDAEVPVIDKEGEWTRVIYNRKICYVASRYLTDDKDWKEHLLSSKGYKDGASLTVDPTWEYADFSAIYGGTATLYLAKGERKGITVGVNAGHGTKGGTSVKTWCHPDKTPKVTGGTTAAGETKAVAVSAGMNFADGTKEADVNLKEAILLKEILLARGYDVLMIRESNDVQLDNVARTVICNNAADCHIAIHWDGDGLDYDKGCYYMSVPNSIKYLPSVAMTWEKSEALGNALIQGLSATGNKIFSVGSMDMDLTQTSYSTVPSVDIELGNQSSNHGDEKLKQLAEGLAKGIELFYGF